MSDIATRIAALRAKLPEGVALLAVSKYHTPADILAAYAAGQRLFGESRTRELMAKHNELPADIVWHFIGHLQRNKVGDIAPFVSLIHAVDSLRLLVEIDRQAELCDRRIDCLIQLHVAAEKAKFGFTPAEAMAMLDDGAWRTMNHVRLRGVMCMATNTPDMEQVAREFDTAHQFFLEARARHFVNEPSFDIRSWGMSHDYTVAVVHGANMVRVGSYIFS